MRLLQVCAVSLTSLALGFLSPLHGQDAITEPVLVRADRLPNAEASAPFAVEVITADELAQAPQLRLDDVLRAQVPGFSLFRRSSSRVANPTTQGVTLRNFGPNGAGRTLVLLDGIPLNDPFAGYVLWNQAPPSTLETIVVQPGGGAGLFGNAALAGTIFLLSRRGETDSAYADGSVGKHDTDTAAVGGQLVRGPVSLSAHLERFSTGGYPVLQGDQRGPIDSSASADSDVLQFGGSLEISSTTSLRGQARRFREQRGNGTILTGNDTLALDLSAVLTTKFTALDAELQLAGYAQRRRFRSTFSSVNSTRDIETPALDQFRVPANAAGGSVVWSMPLGLQHSVTLGGDARWIEGETNEAFRFIGDEFTRLRTAGGKQIFIGAFAEDTWNVSSATRLVGGMRIDHWRVYDGARREFDRSTGAPVQTTQFRDRDGYSINGRIGAAVSATRSLTLRAAGYSGFRVPTLNELYRPFRVGNAVTEANADLEPEQLLGGEVGLEWRPMTSIRLGATAFYNRLENAIGNITIDFGPGTFDPGGFIPAGGVLRQRENVELVTAPGIEMAFDWQVAAPLLVKMSYLFSQPKVERAEEAALVGNLLAQSPEHALNAAFEWRPAAKWLLTAQLRYSGRQFEDDQNEIELAPFTVMDAGVFYQLSANLAAAVKIENLFAAEIETGKSPDGLVSIGAPRLFTLQLRAEL